MLRVEIVRATQNVAEALSSSQVLGALARMDATELVCAHAGWVARRQGFGPPEEQVLDSLGLSQLDDPQFWAKTLTDGANRDPQFLGVISEMHRHARFAQEELPGLVDSLLARTTSEGAANLSVLVIEDEEFSTPGRLALALSAIDTLYGACAEAHSKPDCKISVATCDSGGDKSFDFVGDTEVMGTVKEILRDFWDRVVFFRDDKTESRLTHIAQSLRFLEDVSQWKGSGAMKADTADDIRAKITGAVVMFGQAGATVPEIQDLAAYDPRDLMRPNTDMLASAKKPAAVEAGAAQECEPSVEMPAVETDAPAEAPVAVATPAEPESAPAATPLDAEELRRLVAAGIDEVLHPGSTDHKDAATEEPDIAEPHES